MNLYLVNLEVDDSGLFSVTVNAREPERACDIATQRAKSAGHTVTGVKSYKCVATSPLFTDRGWLKWVRL